MPKVIRTYAVAGQGAYYCEDIAALGTRSIEEADRWNLPGVTPGFEKVREVAQTLSVGLELDNGTIAWGDCVGVSYGGKSGREPIFRAVTGAAIWQSAIAPAVNGHRVDDIHRSWELVDTLAVPMALRYGLSQALVEAAALAQGVSQAEVWAKAYGFQLSLLPLRLQGSCGNDRYSNADKMIVNRLDALPHTQVDDFEKQFGTNGEVLLDYAAWLVKRIGDLGSAGYRPVIHLDVHGAIGRAFGGETAAMAAYIQRLEAACSPYDLRVESALIQSTLEGQLQSLHRLRQELRAAGSKVGLVVDEWANTEADIERFAESGAVDMIHIKMPNLGGIQHSYSAVEICRRNGVGALLGGSCIETDISTRASLHLALAVRPDVFLIKPGMGINEAVSMVRNEIHRTLCVLGRGVA